MQVGIFIRPLEIIESMAEEVSSVCAELYELCLYCSHEVVSMEFGEAQELKLQLCNRLLLQRIRILPQPRRSLGVRNRMGLVPP